MTTATANLTTTVLRCAAPACHPDGLSGFLFAISADHKKLQVKCPRCGSRQVVNLQTLAVVLE